jgi:hypothetical protein
MSALDKNRTYGSIVEEAKMEKPETKSAKERKAKGHYSPERHRILVGEKEPQVRLNVNHGGTCRGCGAPMGYWYNDKICDKCIVVPTNSVYDTKKQSYVN